MSHPSTAQRRNSPKVLDESVQYLTCGVGNETFAINVPAKELPGADVPRCADEGGASGHRRKVAQEGPLS